MCLRIYIVLLVLSFVLNFTDSAEAQKKELNFSCNYDPQNFVAPFPFNVLADSLSYDVNIHVENDFLASVEFNDSGDTLAEFHCKFSIWDTGQDKKIETETLLLQMGFESVFYQEVKFEHQIDSSNCLLVEIAGVNSVYEYVNILCYEDIKAKGKKQVAGQKQYMFNPSDPDMLLETVGRLLDDDKVDSLLKKTGDSKIALDLFWYKAANGDMILAKEAVRVFYNRVKTALLLFGDDPRSDIYILFGLPDFVQKINGREVWKYSSIKNGELTFTQENGSILIDTTSESKALIKRAVHSWCNAHPIIE